MSLFADYMDASYDARAHVLGDEVTWTHRKTGNTSTLRVIFDEYLGMLDDRARGMATARAADFSEAPERGDTFTLDSRPWTVTRLIDTEDGELQVEIIGPTEVS